MYDSYIRKGIRNERKEVRNERKGTDHNHLKENKP